MSVETEAEEGFSRLQIVVFGLIFSLIYTGFNALVVLRLGGLLGVGRAVLYPWIGIVSLSLPVSMYLERAHPNRVSRTLYAGATVWMGILFFTVCTLLVFEVIRFFYPVPKAGSIIVLVVGAVSIVSVFNAIGIEVEEIAVPVENLETEITVVQLSDIHLGSIRNSAFLETVVEKTTALDPDIVLITGDLIDGSAKVTEGMFEEFDTIEAPVYFVSGNHEVYEGIDAVYSKLADSPIQVLKNERLDYEGTQIIGVEYAENDGHLGAELENVTIDESKPAVLMYHAPEGVEEAKQAGIDLQLGGHTHAGQVFPFNFLVRLLFKYIAGRYDLGGMVLYVSQGTGTWGPYMRLGSRNEITKITLEEK